MAPDPILVLSGLDWGANFMCPWVLRGPGILIDSDNRGPEDGESLPITNHDLRVLVGREIVAVTSDPDMIDFVLHLDGELDLAVYTDSDVDPWMIELPEITLTGSAPAE
ncbi:hypothetical protein [Mycetocola sp. JXN-3]|uniref:hypothetical protein n=1 Tax=Mycetocola sp. JXN-3 TaxID=2116510 RepID=UPI00165D16F3|nr:hypothetical protein [Mycetocola sp. JXN-3]